jgi:hypothetical protein
MARRTAAAAAAAVGVALAASAAGRAAAQPPLPSLASIVQPVNQPVYGAPSVTNAWGSLLASTANVLGINAVEVPPFSSGWSADNLYGWPVDAAALSVNGAAVPPATTQWTPYSVIRNGTAVGGTVSVSTEVRMVFEAAAVLLEANITAVGASPPPTSLDIAVDLRLPLRYYPRADACPSWHYPTHSVPCCFNWFPPQPAPGEDGPAVFVPAWTPCSAPYAALTLADALSPAVSAFSFPGACGGGGDGGSDAAGPASPSSPAAAATAAPGVVLDLGPPPSVIGSVGYWGVNLGGGAQTTARIRIALVFSNSSNTASTAAAAIALAASFDAAWADAAGDWAARYAAAFDPAHPHFSGHLPLVSTTPGDGPGGFDTTFASGTPLSPIERIYYTSVVSLLANERTNLPVTFPADPPACPGAVPADGAPPPPPSPPVPTTTPAADAYIPASAAGERLPPAAWRSGLDRYLVAVPVPGGGDGMFGIPRMTGSSYSSVAPGRVFITGGGMNTTTNVFYWDLQYSAQLLNTIDPDAVLSILQTFLSSADGDTPSYWAFWGQDLAARRGIGNYYAANDFTLSELLHTAVRLSGNWSLLNSTVAVPYANGTVAHPTLYSIALAMATHWRDMNASGCLADYGGAPNLLECVPTYIHRVAAVNAGNAWMGQAWADVAEAWAGDASTAASLRAGADCVAADVLARLYLPGTGYFAAEQLNGTAIPVRHVMDHVYTTLYLGVVGGSADGGAGGAAYIPAADAADMGAFVRDELIVPHWMRALSLNDSAAPLSNRSDHGPSGAYAGWPSLTARAMGVRRDYAGALAFLNDTAFVATLGPYGQAVEVRPPGDPYKPMVFTLYNALAGASLADAITRTLFGFVPPPDLPGRPLPPSPLVDAGTPRGFAGVLAGVSWRGALWDVVSGPAGLTLQPHAAGGG